MKNNLRHHCAVFRQFAFLFVVTGLVVVGCTNSTQEAEHDHGAEDGWAVTAWGENYEIFAEADPLVAGETSRSHTHVTFIHDFSAVNEGAVSVALVASDGTESVFKQDEILRAGIFDVEMTPTREGVFDLRFRVEAQGLSEEISAGRIRVGVAGDPGGLIEKDVADDDGHDHGDDDHGHAHDDAGGHAHAPTGDGATVVSFLKEQQWKTPFRTEWTRVDEIHEVVSGAGRTQPVAGSEILLTASLTGEVAASQWPYAGKSVVAGDVVFRLAPRAGENQSLAELKAEEAEHRAELELAREQLRRLEALLDIEGASRAEVEAAQARVTALNAQHEAAKENLRVARGAGRSGDGRGFVKVTTPISGQVAEVFVTPGEVVDAGHTLARVVRTDPFWVEVYLHPAKAALLGDEAHGLLLRGAGMREPVRFGHEPVRLVSRSPVVDEHTGRVACIFEVSGSDAKLPLGAAVEADVLLATAKVGVVVPATAIVDDAGIDIVYVQVDGEGFVRREIEIVAREADRLLVYGLELNERLVTVGGAAIRRAGLVASDVGHGHVH